MLLRNPMGLYTSTTFAIRIELLDFNALIPMFNRHVFVYFDLTSLYGSYILSFSSLVVMIDDPLEIMRYS